jgi:hypothetical protein
MAFVFLSLIDWRKKEKTHGINDIVRIVEVKQDHLGWTRSVGTNIHCPSSVSKLRWYRLLQSRAVSENEQFEKMRIHGTNSEYQFALHKANSKATMDQAHLSHTM